MAGARIMIDEATGIDLSRANPILLAMVTGAPQWIRVLAYTAWGLVVLVIATAWIATSRWNADTSDDGATVTWAVVVGVSCFVAGVLLFLAAMGRLPWGVSLAFGIVAPLVITLDLILLAVASQTWPSWVQFLSILILVLGGVALTFGILCPAIARLIRTVASRTAPQAG